MKKIRQYLSIFLTLAVTLTCFADTSVYAQTGEPLGQAAESDSGTVRELPIDRSFKVPVTEGLLSDNISKYAYEKWTHCITSYLEETEEGGCRRIEASDDKVYSGGDLTGQLATVAWAARAGREAAKSIIEDLK